MRKAVGETSAPLLGRMHLAIGLAGVVMFLATGQYMDTSLDHLRGMADAHRGLYRSGHIYILLTPLMHLLLGSYTAPRRGSLGRGAQYSVVEVDLTCRLSSG